MSFMDAREAGSKPGSGFVSGQQEVRFSCCQNEQHLLAAAAVLAAARSVCALLRPQHWLLLLCNMSAWLVFKFKQLDVTYGRRSTAASVCGGWRWRRSTSARTPTSCATTWGRCGRCLMAVGWLPLCNEWMVQNVDGVVTSF